MDKVRVARELMVLARELRRGASRQASVDMRTRKALGSAAKRIDGVDGDLADVQYADDTDERTHSALAEVRGLLDEARDKLWAFLRRS